MYKEQNESFWGAYKKLWKKHPILMTFVTIFCGGFILGLWLISELLPLLEAGASWEVSSFVSQIYLPSSSGSSCPVFLFPNISTSLFQCFLYSVPHCNLYQSKFHRTHIYSFFLIISAPL